MYYFPAQINICLMCPFWISADSDHCNTQYGCWTLEIYLLFSVWYLVLNVNVIDNDSIYVHAYFCTYLWIDVYKNISHLFYMHTVLVTIEILVHNVEYLEKTKNKSSESALVFWQLMVGKEQQMIKQVYINLVIFHLYLKIWQKHERMPVMMIRILSLFTFVS